MVTVNWVAAGFLDSVIDSKKIWRGEVGNRSSPHALLSQGTRPPSLPCDAHSAGERCTAEYGLIPKAHGDLLYARKVSSSAGKYWRKRK
jgi:hypothetical protein